MEVGHFQHDVSTASSLPRVVQPNHPQLRGFPEKDWVDPKLIICKLCLDRGQILEQLANLKYLEEIHGFRPKKIQLLYRISGWEFEKNVKKDERRELREVIQKLSRKLQNLDYAPQDLRERTIDKKLNRWMRRGNMEVKPYLGDISEEVPNKAAKEPTPPEETSTNEDRMAVESPIEDLQVVSSLPNEQNFMDWSCVDVIESPRLSALFGALIMDEYGLSDDILNLELVSNSLEDVDISGMDLIDLYTGSDWVIIEEDPSMNEYSLARIIIPTNASRMVKTLKLWTQPTLLSEPDPFPTSFNHLFDVFRLFSSNISSLPKMSKSKCLIKFRKLGQLQDMEINNLINRMGAIAFDLYESEDYATAESWYRRIVTAKQRIKWHKPEQTLLACVQIPNCLHHQGRYGEAQQLHQDLHAKIERILGSEHPISNFSRLLKGKILENLGHPAEAETILRQFLQVCLNSFGVKHPDTTYALESLGANLIALGRDAEAQHLCEITLYLLFQTKKTWGNAGDSEWICFRQ